MSDEPKNTDRSTLDQKRPSIGRRIWQTGRSLHPVSWKESKMFPSPNEERHLSAWSRAARTASELARV